MVIALAGRRVDPTDTTETRFPLENAAAVRDRLLAVFQEVGGSALVCSAACGADLLGLEAAASLGLRRRVVLPFHPDRFRQTSVIDRPGDWGLLYDTVIAELQSGGDLVVMADRGEEAYAAANRRILDEAEALAERSGEGVLAVIAWEGRSRGEGDLTEAFAEEARSRGCDVQEVRTL